MNKHDEVRKRQLIRTLNKAKEQAESYGLYLSVDPANYNDTSKANDVFEHIENALEVLNGVIEHDQSD